MSKKKQHNTKKSTAPVQQWFMRPTRIHVAVCRALGVPHMPLLFPGLGK